MQAYINGMQYSLSVNGLCIWGLMVVRSPVAHLAPRVTGKLSKWNVLLDLCMNGSMPGYMVNSSNAMAAY